MKFLTQSLFILVLFSVSTVFAQNRKMPSVELTNLKGEKVNLAELHKSGKIIVVDFWATWCIPCKKELTNINEVYADWQKKYNVEVVAISEDNAQTSPKVKASVNGARWIYNVLLDPNGDLKHSLNFQNIPYTLLINKDGNIVYTHEGYVDGDEDVLEAQIKKVAGK
jgi:cytochrome c biogenesis protein CcmG/thiol:disulfide interchange protein DsbE